MSGRIQNSKIRMQNDVRSRNFRSGAHGVSDPGLRTYRRMNVSFDFSGKVAVVTGGAKGIGGSTSTRFLEGGAQVAILDTDEEAGRERAAAFPDRALFIQCDVSKSSEVAMAFDSIIDRFGGVDYLVNNAGIQRYSTVTETSDEEWDLVMGVNLKSAFLCARAAIPSMLERGAASVRVRSIRR